MEQIINNPLVACVISLSVLVIALMFIAINLYVKIANIKVEINNLTDANQDRIKDLASIRKEQESNKRSFADTWSAIQTINKVLSEPLYSVGDVVEFNLHGSLGSGTITDVYQNTNCYTSIIEPKYKVDEDENRFVIILQSQITAHY